MIPEEQHSDDLIDAILALENEEEARNFFIDLCTRNELVLMQQRYAVAKMLHENKTYQDIVAKTGASTATISRVSRTLNNGEGGYLQAINKQKDADS